MHHALQCVEPDWSIASPGAGRGCREPKRILRSVADMTQSSPAHFPGQTAGYVDTDGETWRWRYMEFDNGQPTASEIDNRCPADPLQIKGNTNTMEEWQKVLLNAKAIKINRVLNQKFSLEGASGA